LNFKSHFLKKPLFCYHQKKVHQVGGGRVVLFLPGFLNGKKKAKLVFFGIYIIK